MNYEDVGLALYEYLSVVRECIIDRPFSAFPGLNSRVDDESYAQSYAKKCESIEFWTELGPADRISF